MNNDITLRDYLAAHAPAEPQAWFEPEMPEPYPEADPDWRWCEACTSEIGTCRGTADCHELHLHTKAINEWSDRRRQARLAQWPYAWADAVLASRRKHP